MMVSQFCEHLLHSVPRSVVFLSGDVKHVEEDLVLVHQLDPGLGVGGLEGGADGVEDAAHVGPGALLIIVRRRARVVEAVRA